MSPLAGWLDLRRPTPPAGLAARLSVDEVEGEPLRALTDRGRSELDRARATLGPVRESALHLLTADAFVTYACEAALESSDPSEALARLVEEVAKE